MSRGRSGTATGVAMLVVALAVLTALASAPRAQTRPSRRDSESFRQKVAAIASLGEHPSKQLHRTTITEGELNAYLLYDVGDGLPAGVVNPAVSVVGDGRLSGRATVDLDAVRKASNPTSLFDPRSFLGGRLPLTVTGTLSTSNGTGRFAVESVTLAGVTMPQVVLQEILGYYSRTPGHPSGVSLDAPFELTAHIREIRVERGQAIIVQ